MILRFAPMFDSSAVDCFSDGVLILASVIRGPGRSNLTTMPLRPVHQTTDRLEQGRAQFGERVFHLRWHDGVHRAVHQAVALELAKGEGQHALADSVYFSPKLAEPLRASVEHGNHQDRPLVANPIQYLTNLDRLGGIAAVGHTLDPIRVQRWTDRKYPVGMEIVTG